MKVKKVCIVTPDFVGPIRNGGIGTHCYHLSLLLASAGHETTVLYTGGFEVGDARHWARHFAGMRIHFVSSIETELDGEISSPSSHMADSMRVHKYLSARDFDIVHFQCWQGNGFVPTQAKSCGLAYKNTTITETLHATESWALEGMKAFPDNELRHSYQDYCERYSFGHADYGLSPTEHMFEWTRSRGWDHPARTRIIPYPFLQDREQLRVQAPRFIDTGHLVFFGRIETRKGFELFVDALKVLARGSALGIRKVSLVGKLGSLTNSGCSPVEMIGGLEAIAPRLEITWHTQLDHLEALRYIVEQGGVLVIPSLLDNSPFTIIEAMTYGVPFIASAVGGIPEIAGQGDHIFEPTCQSLAAAISRLGNIPFRDLVYPYSAADANSQWLAFHEETLQDNVCVHGSFKPQPKVSVCIAHRNMCDYLSEALRGLSESDYANFEVIVADESDEPKDMQAICRLADEYSAVDWKFLLSEQRTGPSASRNFAARNAQGELLVFFDADNIPERNMISTMVSCMEFSGADCMTCHLKGFAHRRHIQEQQLLYIYAPLGPVLDTGFIHNVFGDTNFIIKREVFSQLGGFPQDNWGLWEDWEFLAGLALEGYRLDVIPEALVWYRHTETGASRGLQVNSYDRYQYVLRPWRKRFPDHIVRVLEARLAAVDRSRVTESPTGAVRLPPEVRLYFKILHSIKFSRFQHAARRILSPVRKALSRLAG